MLVAVRLAVANFYLGLGHVKFVLRWLCRADRWSMPIAVRAAGGLVRLPGKDGIPVLNRNPIL